MIQLMTKADFPIKRRKRWLRRILLLCCVMMFFGLITLYATPFGNNIRVFLAETIITTQHRDWAWVFVGKTKRDELISDLLNARDTMAKDQLDLKNIKIKTHSPLDSLVKVTDISGTLYKGKMMWVYDPKSIRVVVPTKQGEGERITEMVNRTGAVAGLNAGGFDDPEGLGNGFAPIGMVMSDNNVLFSDMDSKQAQHIVGFSTNGTLIVGKYTLDELRKLNVKEAVSFYPRVIVNGKPLITSGDGGWGRAPRTAVGQMANGTVIFIVIDGRQAHSIGATLREVQDLFLQQGVVNAGFLDGGASSELVLNHQLITHPSSRYGERRLPSAFLIFDHPETVGVMSPWQGLTKIDPGGASTHPEYQADLRNRQRESKKSNRASITHKTNIHSTRHTASHPKDIKNLKSPTKS